MDRVSEFCQAIWRGDAGTVSRLISKVDPNAQDRWHRPLLSMAAQYGDLGLMRELLDRGARVDAGRRHLTPISHAAARGAGHTAGIDPEPFIELLLARGADPKQKDKRGRAALRPRGHAKLRAKPSRRSTGRRPGRPR